VAAANVLARQAQAAAHGAANVDRFRPAAPPKYKDKKKGEHVDHWIPVIEDCLRPVLSTRIISGWHPPIWRVDPVPCGQMSTRRTRGQMEGMSPLTLDSSSVRRLRPNYGLQNLDQKYWDTWNSLRMGPSQSITEYNVDFQQAPTDRAGHVTDEQVKIEKYRAGLQHDLRLLCRASPTGARAVGVGCTI
jgi:hypothetical protein